eukprot:CAMPEP_0119361962 /NCGR_PEP_ID=MMETSP1334-20130426/9157_1 /TAXON_ID=127549 /ORGANISM="Calcidiscus leptoporus, Strain RCC1130" /LENGTH=438 /DNA_ID=CAMNT_0007377101 /DNA_START=53 /DNA_END=1369 /DNA_ORIENTATION=-
MLLDVFKDGTLVETVALSASKRLYKVGRQAGLADIVLTHASISREQATLTVSASGSVVVEDVGSAQGTYISGKPLKPRKPHLLAPGRSLVFGKSTRTFKLRAGEGGFVGEATQAAPGHSPLLEALLSVLRCEGGAAAAHEVRMRPDGFAPVVQLAGCRALAQFAVSAPALLELANKKSARSVLELRSEDEETLVRARDGHAAGSHVDVSLKLRSCAGRFDATQLLVYGCKFVEWNVLRSKGAGAGSTRVIRLSTTAPAKGERIPGSNIAPDLLVYVNALHLQNEGVQLFIDLTATASAAEAWSASATGAAGSEAPLALTATGSEADGTIGVALFEKVVSARDGSEMMSSEEIAPIRAARAAQLEAKARAAEAEAERKRKREQARREREAAEQEEAVKPAVKRFNPYLAHAGVGPPPKASNRTAAGPALGPRPPNADDD